MPDKALQLLQAQIGKEMTQNPSAVAMWLRPVFRHVERGELIADYTVRQEMTNAVGNMHGGMIACIMDDLMGTAVFTLGKEFFMTTVNLSVDFLYGAKVGEVLEAHCKIIREGKNIVNATCQIFNKETKTLIASGTSNLVTTSVKKNL